MNKLKWNKLHIFSFNIIIRYVLPKRKKHSVYQWESIEKLCLITNIQYNFLYLFLYCFHWVNCNECRLGFLMWRAVPCDFSLKQYLLWAVVVCERNLPSKMISNEIFLLSLTMNRIVIQLVVGDYSSKCNESPTEADMISLKKLLCPGSSYVGTDSMIHDRR